jgi:predicted TIM-barrel fold metal-dependent hydrolase
MTKIEKNLTRRRFMQYASSSLLAVTALAEPGPTKIPIVDTHTHFYDTTRPQGLPWPSKKSSLYKPHLPDQFVAQTKAYGVAGTVVVEASSWVQDNQWILDLAKDNPVILGFIGNIELGKPEFAGHLKRFSVNPIFRGVRLRDKVVTEKFSDDAFKKDLKRLEEKQLTIDIMGKATILRETVRIAKLAPNLRIVIDHLPFKSWDRDITAINRELSEIAQLPNVYAKISNVVRKVDGRVIEDAKFYHPKLDSLWKLFGPDRMIFGSNWPVSERTTTYANIHKIVADYFNTKGRTAAEKFFWKNSLAAYSWPMTERWQNLVNIWKNTEKVR